MFYVSDISGNLIPFEPGITPLSVTAPSVSSVASTPEVLTPPTAQSFPQTMKSSFVEMPLPPTVKPQQTEEPAVYDGHTILFDTPLTGLNDSGNIGRAGAAAAYLTTESAGAAKFYQEETAINSSSVIPLEGVDDKGGAPHLVNPIKNYRKNAADRKKASVAADIMSSPVFTLKESDPLEEAQKVFRDRKFRHLPIVSDDGRLVGILSDRDFMGTLNQKGSGAIKTKMVTNILTASPQTEISEIAKVMITHHIGCLPIVDEVGLLVGILTRTDILHAIVSHAPIELWT